MKKLLTIVLIATMLATTVPAFALTLNTGTTVPTTANSVAGASVPPIVIAKAEWIQTNLEIDDDSAKPWLQVNPANGFNASKTLGYLVVAECNTGFGCLPGTPGINGNAVAAFADVYNPDGCKKYQVAMPNVISCDDSTPEEITQWINYLNNKANKNLIKFADGWTIDKVIADLKQCSAKLYFGYADVDTCQMCGQFTWGWSCEGNAQIGCVPVWTVLDDSNGYKVDAYVFGKDGTKSNILENHFEYMCQAGIETDFNSLNYEDVQYNQHKWIEGNKIWNDPKGPACKLGVGCVAPSIRNIGNEPVNLTVWQDDMGFGSSTLGWNVQWDARLGEITEHSGVNYDPFVTTAIPGGLDICQLDKISFSILPKKAQDLGSKSGQITITPVPLTFPWFTKTCGCVNKCTVAQDCGTEGWDCISGCCVSIV